MGYAAEKEKQEKRILKYKRIVLLCVLLVFLSLCIFSAFVPPDTWKYGFRKPRVGRCEEGELRVHFVDVGQGDCTIIQLPDDKVMLMIIEEMEKIGITILDQTLFIKNLMIPSGILGKLQPTADQIEDVNYGYWLAKESGKLDIGQSVVIKDKMIMAVEAIEGTDKCIKRGCKIAKKNGRVIKVAKPAQDKRFDIPAIGLRTLKTMKKYKADLIAVEAGETIIVDQEEVVKFANKHNIVIMAV